MPVKKGTKNLFASEQTKVWNQWEYNNQCKNSVKYVFRILKNMDANTITVEKILSHEATYV